MRNIAKGKWWDESLNVVTGCTPVSEGCKNCWAKEMVTRFPTLHDGLPFFDIRIHPEKMEKLTQWRKRRIVAMSFLGDLFHASIPYSAIDFILRRIAECYSHDIFILTKRPATMGRAFLTLMYQSLVDLQANVHVGVTIETQARANERVLPLFNTIAQRRFVHAEPLLGPIDLTAVRAGQVDALSGDVKTKAGEIYAGGRGLDWVVAGAETGRHKRPADLDWFRSLRDQCAAAGVPFFLKQLSDGTRVLDGRTHDEYPEGVE